MPDDTSTGAAEARRARLAAPWIVGGLTAVITAVTTSLDALDLAAPVQVAVTGGVALLAGVAAWGTQQSQPAEASAAPGELEGVTPAQLPPVIAHFTGRAETLADLRRAAADGTDSPASPLVVSLHGPAGVGKSSLAARFAHEIADGYPDGCLYFDLRGTGEARIRPEEVLIGFLQALAQRRYEEARGLLEEALGVFQRNGHRYSEAQTLRALGEVLASEARALRASGDTAAADVKHSLAAPALERAIEAFRLRGEQWEAARCLRAAGETGDPRNGLRELRFVRESARTLEALGDTWGLARTRISEGRALGRLGRHDEAAEALRRAVEAFDELGDRWWQARSRRTLAEVLLNAGLRDQAAAPAHEALDLYQRLGNASGVARARSVLARAGG